MGVGVIMDEGSCNVSAVGTHKGAVWPLVLQGLELWGVSWALG